MTKIKKLFAGVDVNFIWVLATIILAVTLLDAQIFHTLHYPIWRDDATFDAVAKNLANGDGYAAVFFDKSYPFHRVIVCLRLDTGLLRIIFLYQAPS